MEDQHHPCPLGELISDTARMDPRGFVPSEEFTDEMCREAIGGCERLCNAERRCPLAWVIGLHRNVDLYAPALPW